jgi:hypothetical protein
MLFCINKYTAFMKDILISITYFTSNLILSFHLCLDIVKDILLSKSYITMARAFFHF